MAANYTNLLTNHSNALDSNYKSLDLIEEYKKTEHQQSIDFKVLGFAVGSLIILSNLTVVISSGLILKKGQQPKSTYLLLGNMSLADMLVGISIVVGHIVGNSTKSGFVCIFQMGMYVCPAMVSILTVGLIAIDRYIYIVHGLYYRRWISTTKVRIAIICSWLIGLMLSFLPITGWTHPDFNPVRCYYVTIFPGPLILFNSLFSLVPIILVALLYCIILCKALKNMRAIKASSKVGAITPTNSKVPSNKPILRMNRGNNNIDAKPTIDMKVNNLKRCASFNSSLDKISSLIHSAKSKSISDLTSNNFVDDKLPENIDSPKVVEDKLPENKKNVEFESDISISTVESSMSTSISTSSISKEADNSADRKTHHHKNGHKKKNDHKPKKWRAVTVVMLTSGSFIITWVPYFMAVIFFVLCEDKANNKRCLHYRKLLGGPLIGLAFSNSILNPLIYAWWHKGFKRSIKHYFKRYILKRQNNVNISIGYKESKKQQVCS